MAQAIISLTACRRHRHLLSRAPPLRAGFGPYAPRKAELTVHPSSDIAPIVEWGYLIRMNPPPAGDDGSTPSENDSEWLCNPGAPRRPDGGDDGIILGGVACPFWLERATDVARHCSLTRLLLLAALALFALAVTRTARRYSHPNMSDISMADPAPENAQVQADDQSTEDRGLPFPKVVHGKVEVQHLDIDSVDKPTLQDWCRAYGLLCTGTKDVLKGRLREFSGQRDEWDRFVPKARRTHRGAQSTGDHLATRKATKQSARRAADVFENREAHPLPHMPLALPSQNPVQTSAQRAAILDWAKSAALKHPYINKEAREAAAKARLASRGAIMQANNTLLELANTKLSDIQAGISLIAASASVQPVGASTHQEAPVSMTHTPVTPVLSNNIAAGAGTNHAQPEVVSLNPTRPTSSPLPLRSLVLANGTRVEFTAADVPPPPSMSFAHDIPLLNSMWDDASSHWGNYSVLNIRGVYIPITYWKKLFTGQ
ncbi:hypothetical protein HYPSUDRAFT_218463 [Hypholoma sublateritium FD-334 SS-4]|uniref:SAP domain-containing protein n=1 Tax=Hypholoma sublateritium (strain FD-334 SS-4) TaxID=945553 RepID=A0A0D2M4J2_HYPSF|nr:hypothetical protein HYPSUDRAFT_218463 [Hypholoma sublateritium FD-334 SS-4]